MAVIPAKAGTRGEHMDVLSFEERGIHLALMHPLTWMIRFAHPFGAVLRTFSALCAMSRFRGNDGWL